MNTENWTPEEWAALNQRAQEKAIIDGEIAPEHLPPVRLDPILWAPPFVAAKPPPDPAYLAWRRENRPFRRAFGRGERFRKILLAVGAYNAKSKDNA